MTDLHDALTKELTSPRALEPDSQEHTAVMISENSSENWAVAAWQWAEYMGGPLPADTVIWMGITGDHWSSRWWANQALVWLDEAHNWAIEAAASAASAAASAADAALSADLADEFGDLYLGSHATAPTTDNDGDPLQTGALYFDTGFVQMRAWNGTVWQGFETLGDTAADVIFAPTGDITSTTVQNAIIEVYNDSKAYTDSQVGPITTALGNIYNKTEADDKFVDTTGDVMSGDLAIAKASPTLVLNKAASGQAANVIGARSGAWRWIVQPGNGEVEGGSNAGSNFAIYNYDDAGAILGNPFHISRATGSVSFASIPICWVAPTEGQHLANHAYVEQRGNEWGAYHAGLRVLKTGDTMSGKLTVTAGSSYTTGQGAIEIQSVGECMIGFHRPGAYALMMGLNGANTFQLGGWSMGSGHRWYSDPSGNFTATGNVTAYSDARRKKDVETIKDALALVHRMRGVSYTRIDTNEPGVGVIAQEMRGVVPEVVLTEPGGDTLSVAYGNLVGVLIEAIKELAERVEILRDALMTTPAYPNPISIQDIKNEFASRGAYNDLNSWGQVVLGRPSGQAVSLSEFWGRENRKNYPAVEVNFTHNGIPWGGSDSTSGTVGVPNRGGHQYFIHPSWHEFIGDSIFYYGGELQLYNDAAWASFVHVRFGTTTFLKSAFVWTGATWRITWAYDAVNCAANSGVLRYGAFTA